jgi:hypothetical protein
MNPINLKRETQAFLTMYPSLVHKQLTLDGLLFKPSQAILEALDQRLLPTLMVFYLRTKTTLTNKCTPLYFLSAWVESPKKETSKFRIDSTLAWYYDAATERRRNLLFIPSNDTTQ